MVQIPAAMRRRPNRVIAAIRDRLPRTTTEHPPFLAIPDRRRSSVTARPRAVDRRVARVAQPKAEQPWDSGAAPLLCPWPQAADASPLPQGLTREPSGAKESSFPRCFGIGHKSSSEAAAFSTARSG